VCDVFVVYGVTAFGYRCNAISKYRATTTNPLGTGLLVIGCEAVAEWASQFFWSGTALNVWDRFAIHGEQADS
jgi:hypothetical protein